MADAATLRTLIVDDEPLAIERMQIICARIDSVDVVGTASDGESALRLIEALAPDLILLDMTMPGLDGLGVAGAVANTPQAPALVSPPRTPISRSRRSISMLSTMFSSRWRPSGSSERWTGCSIAPRAPRCEPGASG